MIDPECCYKLRTPHISAFDTNFISMAPSSGGQVLVQRPGQMIQSVRTSQADLGQLGYAEAPVCSGQNQPLRPLT